MKPKLDLLLSVQEKITFKMAFKSVLRAAGKIRGNFADDGARYHHVNANLIVPRRHSFYLIGVLVIASRQSEVKHFHLLLNSCFNSIGNFLPYLPSHEVPYDLFEIQNAPNNNHVVFPCDFDSHCFQYAMPSEDSPKGLSKILDAREW